MNRLVLLALSIIQFSKFDALPINDLKILHIDYEDADCVFLLDNLKIKNPTLICVSGQADQINDFYELHLKETYPYVLNNEHVIILSQINLNHFHIYHFDPSNFVIEAASNNIDKMLLYAHLPNFTEKQIAALNSYVQTITPYTPLALLADFTMPIASLWDVCVGMSVGGKGEMDTNGNKGGSVDFEIHSDDKKAELKVECSLNENDKGEKSGSVKAEGRVRY